MYYPFNGTLNVMLINFGLLKTHKHQENVSVWVFAAIGTRIELFPDILYYAVLCKTAHASACMSMYVNRN